MAQKRLTWEGLWSALCNVCLSLVFCYFLRAHGLAFLECHRVSLLFLMAKETIDVTMYLSRGPATAVSRSAYSFIIAFCGTAWPMLYRPTHDRIDFLLPSLLQAAAILFQIYAMVSLNRSFGFVAANRGIKTRGLYRFVRHPLYLGYISMQFGYLINNFSTHNLSVFALATFLQVLRIFEEENLLRKDEQYQTYAAQIRWRLIPGLF
jgi:protein-S-isoprenylcysteine O-methyltransferase Ste14